MSKLSLDRDQIDLCRHHAEQIIRPVLHNINRHTTVSIERSMLRLLGVEGTAEEKPKEPAPQGRYPLVNELLDKIGIERLSRGASYWFGLASAHHPRLTASTLARKIVSGEIDLNALQPLPVEKIDEAAQAFFSKTVAKLRQASDKRRKRPAWRMSTVPLRYVIVATGNIHEDLWQAQAAAEMGADIIAVIRSTAQSLLDYVPEGETSEGFGGTFATQENFRLMRQALDQSEKKLKRRIALTNYSSGLCMPEIAVAGALEGIDYLLNDAMYGILFRDINMKRNFIDQYFSRRICALSGIVIQTGEDNYLTTAEAHKSWYQVLASHFINEAFAKSAGLADNQIALGHAHEIDPWIEDSILYEWAQAQLVREIFPRNPIKFMPPTKHKTGDIFFSYLYDGLFNLAGIMTGQNIQLLGMHSEAIHNPFVQDRFLSLKNANYIFRGAKSLQEEILFQSNGKIARRGRQMLDEAAILLKKIRGRGLLKAIEEGAFANVKRGMEAGKGLEGVLEKDRDYYTPMKDYLAPKQQLEGAPRFPGGRQALRDRRSGGDDSRVREGRRSRERAMPSRERGPRRSSERNRGRLPGPPPRPVSSPPPAAPRQAPLAAEAPPKIQAEVQVETPELLTLPPQETAVETIAANADATVSTEIEQPTEAESHAGALPRRSLAGNRRRRGRRGGRGRGRGPYRPMQENTAGQESPAADAPVREEEVFPSPGGGDSETKSEGE
ncbi:MAG TPA: D-lysine 5,6-aminomutase subunit alpha [Deltaproteobacteria bacterium]|nr:D-lysine 5,6-aminomutase subunit alpha [Deltaproteobacteria bacterium]